MIQGDPGARLSVTISNGMTVEVRLGQKEVKIGRGHEADLQLPDPSVSRLHAKVFRVGRQYFLADLRSRNGTHADGRRITQLSLEDGRMFQVGPFRIHFHRSVSGFSAGEEPTVPPGTASAISATVEAEPVCVPKRKEALTITCEAPFGLIGGSAHVRKLVATIRRVAASDVPVLIEGETGSGKELVARGIHDASARRERPFIVVNCGAISPELIESELFGHEKGAFTGATAQRKGAFELANYGTIFLDEIGELPIYFNQNFYVSSSRKKSSGSAGTICCWPTCESSPPPTGISGRRSHARRSARIYISASAPSRFRSLPCGTGGKTWRRSPVTFSRGWGIPFPGRCPASPPPRWTPSSPTTGRETCASCETRSSGPW